MHNAKRSGSVAKSNLNNDLKKACSASKAAMLTGLEEPSAKRFMPSSPAIITTAPVVFVPTALSMADRTVCVKCDEWAGVRSRAFYYNLRITHWRGGSSLG